MSLPEFQTGTSLTREEAINQIISSIAMEELGLSHIINAEGEKLQYVLGTIPGVSGPKATIEDVLKVNESVRMVLQSAAESQSILRNKLQNALSSSVLTGPTGPSGPAGATGTGLILPFSSGGEEMDIKTDVDGNPAYPSIVGIGAFNTSAAFTAEDGIDLSGSPDVASEFATLIPRGGTITDVSARFRTAEVLDLTGTTVTVTVQLYKSTSSTSDVFSQIGSVTLEPVLGPNGSYPIGTVLSVTKTSLNFPVESGARLLLAFKAHAEGTAPEITLTGHANASIGIS